MECPICSTDIDREAVLILPYHPGVWEVSFYCHGCSKHIMHLLENWQVI